MNDNENAILYIIGFDPIVWHGDVFWQFLTGLDINQKKSSYKCIPVYASK